MNNSKIGEIMRKVRKENDWTQADLAQLLGECESYVSWVETGRIIPNSRFCLNLAMVLKSHHGKRGGIMPPTLGGARVS